MVALHRSLGMTAMGAWSRKDFEESPRDLLSRDSMLKPRVYRVLGPSGPCIVKDVAGLGFFGRFLARWLLAREARALGKLDGVEGVPQVLHRLDRDALAMSLLPGRPLCKESFLRQPRRITDRLLLLADAIHERGVFHMDLRQRQNILLDDQGGVGLVDFGAAFSPGPLGRWVFSRPLSWVDRQGVTKFLARWVPSELTPEEARGVLRAQRLRRLWIFTPHIPDGEEEGAREKLKG